MNLLFLDFDDCIINWNISPIDRLKELRFNLQCIKDFCLNNNYKIGVTSSWSPLFYPDSLQLKDKFNDLPGHEKEIVKVLNEHIGDLVIYTDKYKDRVKFIKELSNKYLNNLHLVLDDFPLPELADLKNVIYLQTINGIMYRYKGEIVGNLLKLDNLIKKNQRSKYAS